MPKPHDASKTLATAGNCLLASQVPPNGRTRRGAENAVSAGAAGAGEPDERGHSMSPHQTTKPVSNPAELIGLNS